MPNLFLYNSLTRTKAAFEPIKPKTVGLYTCGPTVYNFAHIGNLRTYLFEDVLKRTLIYNGYRVKHIENITDVGHLVSDADEGEDKMMKALRRDGLKPTVASLHQLANTYTKAFQNDLQQLNILMPSRWVRATDHITAIVTLIKKIEKNGYAYQTDDGLYFDTSKFKNYGALAGLNLAQLRPGARVAVNPQKKNPLDFALWIKAVGDNKNHLMQWPSPWGTGFPGWHIECSAMSIKYLGAPFDIHCGGIDHLPVHHTNEIAQNEAAIGKPSVRFWSHGEFLTIDENRMGKSEGNFITLQTVIDKGFETLALRYLSFQTHYRQKLTFSWDALSAAQTALQNLREKISSYGSPKIGCAEYEVRFLDAINDDLNMPQALAIIWELVKDQTMPPGAKKQSLVRFDAVLGLGLGDIKKQKIPAAITTLANQRVAMRLAKDWAGADEARKKIEAAGYLIEDTADGFSLKKSHN